MKEIANKFSQLMALVNANQQLEKSTIREDLIMDIKALAQKTNHLALYIGSANSDNHFINFTEPSFIISDFFEFTYLIKYLFVPDIISYSSEVNEVFNSLDYAKWLTIYCNEQSIEMPRWTTHNDKKGDWERLYTYFKSCSQLKKKSWFSIFH